MKVNILAFGIAKEIVGSQQIELTLPNNTGVSELKTELESKYPELKRIASYLIAINNTYAGGNEMLNEHDEIAIIPPVSGG